MTEPLKFKVAPHIVEDLGLNLYTSLSRVIVEYIANAYDADSDHVIVALDVERIANARKEIKEAYAKENITQEAVIEPLETRTLSSDIQITIEDEGHGMSREDLDKKFLVAGRRRRKEGPSITKKGRIVMGRKGLGKLAGFGVAKKVEIITRKEGEEHSTQIILDYDVLLKSETTHEIEIIDKRLEGELGLKKSGTRVVLSNLLFDPSKNQEATIIKSISDHFHYIDRDDFFILFNNEDVPSVQPDFAFAWPNPEVNYGMLVGANYEYSNKQLEFQYRIRFRKEREALTAQERGVRVYAHKRLAAAPSLLDADTNMHGFRLTDYLDGVVCADFIDNQDVDFIATDRQGLRWDSPLLAILNEFLSDEIKEACKQYQKIRDERNESEIREDVFTTEEIGKHALSPKEKTIAVKLAGLLRNSCKMGLADETYKEKLPLFLSGIGTGALLSRISELAEQDSPRFREVATEFAKLAADEYEQFVTYAKIKLKAIETFKNLVKSADFNKPENERTVQKMFEKSPWLLNTEFSQYIAADTAHTAVFSEISKYLEIGDFCDAKKINENERPDLVFLLGDSNVKKLIIVELKSTNTPLISSHLDQLLSYIKQAKIWLSSNGQEYVQVQGILVGTHDKPESKKRGVLALQERLDELGTGRHWQVKSFNELLKDTLDSHKELIDIYNATEKADV